MDNHREGTVYLVVRPGRYGYYSLVADKVTNKKPQTTSEGSVVIKLKLRLPRAAFEPLQPSAVLTVPEDLVQHPVSIEAVEGE